MNPVPFDAAANKSDRSIEIVRKLVCNVTYFKIVTYQSMHVDVKQRILEIFPFLTLYINVETQIWSKKIVRIHQFVTRNIFTFKDLMHIWSKFLKTDNFVSVVCCCCCGSSLIVPFAISINILPAIPKATAVTVHQWFRVIILQANNWFSNPSRDRPNR